MGEQPVRTASWARVRAVAPPWPRRRARAAAPLRPHGRACELRLRHGLMGACVRHRGREASSGREQRAPAPPLPQIHDASARSSPCCRRPLLRFSFNGGRPAAGTEKERGRKKNGLTSWAKGNLGKSSPFLAETGRGVFWQFKVETQCPAATLRIWGVHQPSVLIWHVPWPIVPTIYVRDGDGTSMHASFSFMDK